ATILAITTQFIGYNNVSPTYRIHLSIYIAENSINPEQLPSLLYKVALALIQSLKSRFPDTNLYNTIKIFDPKLLPSKEDDLSNYRNTKIKIPADFYRNDKETNTSKTILALINKQELKQEWVLVKEMMKPIQKFN
ncbi:10232_t:CDS:1, partial [Gigaspora margarita]